MKDPHSPSRESQGRERLARAKALEQLIEYALAEGLTIEQIEADKTNILRIIEERNKSSSKPKNKRKVC